MTPEQITRLLDVLERIASKSQSYTLTGAADWPLLLAIGFVVMALVGFMWRDLRETMQSNKVSAEKDIDNIWNGMRDCKADCCDRARVNRGG